MREEKEFQTESKQLLDLMINSIYSNQEIFLRELISNASDAIDKYRYLSLTNSEKYPQKSHEIFISVDKKAKSLTIRDTGIGMSKVEIEKNLGTIAKSGSSEFIKKYKDFKENNDLSIIGQFGVGFYSAFIVAKRVEVISKPIDGKAHLFVSVGKDKYTIEDVESDMDSGTEITLFLKDDTKETNYSRFLEQYEIESLIKKYSDYIRYPIRMLVKTSKPKLDKEGKEIEGKYEDVEEIKTLNSMIPLWKKNPKEITEEELNNFYKDKFSDFENPMLNVNISLEGFITYKALLFVPSHLPYNIYSDDYEKGLTLYTKGVFIKDHCKELIPDYLKFVKGVVDSEDFPLNISREMLQNSSLLNRVQSSIEKKVIDKLAETKKNNFDLYKKFFKIYGNYLKGGIYESYGQKKDLLQDLLIFSTTKDEDLIDLDTYVSSMEKKQKYIYFASGRSHDEVVNLPQLEKFKEKGINVLLLSEAIDEFVLSMMNTYKDKEFKNISMDSEADLSDEEKAAIEEATNLHKRALDNLKESLNSKVDDVIFSSKLIDSPCCLTSKDSMSLNMERILKDQSRLSEEEASFPTSKKVLELNPKHPLVQNIISIEDDDLVKEYGSLLYDEALMLEGIEIEDKIGFVKKINSLIVKK
ncbi:MAG: molecular chaperone HtpG [Bacilli bacterium]|nr:molecular chaperone HtpG [Bacilli bacterium]